MLQEVSLRGRDQLHTKDFQFEFWWADKCETVKPCRSSSCFLILLSFMSINCFHKHILHFQTWTHLFLPVKTKMFFLWLLFDCCVYMNDCDITLLWGEVQAVTLLSVSLSGWVLPPASEAVTPSTSRLAAELSPTGPSRCGNSASFTSSAVDRRTLCASPRWESFTETENVSWARRLGFWRETGPCPEGGRWEAWSRRRL